MLREQAAVVPGGNQILCAFSVFSVSLWLITQITTETQRTQRLRREKEKRCLPRLQLSHRNSNPVLD